MKVPESLRVVFDTFPLRSYPPIPGLYGTYEDQIFHFKTLSSNADDDKNETFSLGIHNAVPLQVNGASKRVPTDPFGLALALILCRRHHLLLPTEDDHLQSQHSLVKLSYEASPSNELPILIESSNGATRSIQTTQEILKSIELKNFADDAQVSLFNLFLDTLGDLWIFVLLVDLPKNDQAAYRTLFGQDSEIDNSYVSDLQVLKLVADVPQWSSFKVRYSHLFDNSRSYATKLPSRLTNSSILEIMAVSDPTAFEKVYLEKLMEFQRILPLLHKYLSSEETSEAKAILELKLVAFVICIDKFVSPTTQIGQVVQKKQFKNIVIRSREVLQQY